MQMGRTRDKDIYIHFDNFSTLSKIGGGGVHFEQRITFLFISLKLLHISAP